MRRVMRNELCWLTVLRDTKGASWSSRGREAGEGRRQGSGGGVERGAVRV